MSSVLQPFYAFCRAYIQFTDDYPVSDAPEIESRLFCDYINTNKPDEALIAELEKFVIEKKEILKTGIVNEPGGKPTAGKIFNRGSEPIITISTDNNIYNLNMSFVAYNIGQKTKPVGSTKKEPGVMLLYYYSAMCDALIYFVYDSEGITKDEKEEIKFNSISPKTACPYNPAGMDHIRTFLSKALRHQKVQKFGASSVGKSFMEKTANGIDNFDMEIITRENVSADLIEAVMEGDVDKAFEKVQGVAVNLTGALHECSERKLDPTDQFD